MTLDKFILQVETDLQEQGDYDSAWTEIQTKELVLVVQEIRQLRTENAQLRGLVYHITEEKKGGAK